MTPIPFGFLPYKCEILFDNGKIVPNREFDRALKWVDKQLNKDGHFYPPIVKQVETDLNWKPIRTVSKTKRPARLYRLPPSHDLYISPAKSETNIREGSAGFAIHLLAFLFKTRLQFAGWHFDGRIPMKRSGAFAHQAIQAGSCLSRAYKVWSRWPEEDQKRFTNILYMYSRESAYNWDWEIFIIQYMVLDACWKMAERLFLLNPKTPHAKRAHVLCEKLSIGLPKDFIDLDLMVKLRNGLFHEVLWHGGRPSSTIGDLPYSMPMRLGVLNEMIIRALIEKSARRL